MSDDELRAFLERGRRAQEVVDKILDVRVGVGGMTSAPWAPTGCATCDRSLLRSDWLDEQGMHDAGADVRAAVADRITAGHVDCPPIGGDAHHGPSPAAPGEPIR